MDYQGNIIRPPSEANSILLQVTTGCSHNKCTFCGAYKDKGFSIKPMDVIEKDIIYASQYFQNINRLFLCDGDALIIPYDKLIHIINLINKHLPWLNRISTYANAKSISYKSDEELSKLRNNKLKLFYIGLESGDDEVLSDVVKGKNSQEIILQCKRAKEQGIKISLTILLGLGGISNTKNHAINTGKVISQINPDQFAALSLMLVPGTELYDDKVNGKFELPNKMDLLKELLLIIENTEVEKSLFLSNHASNYLPLRARLPRDKNKIINEIQSAIEGNINLRPEFLRGL